MPFPALSRSRTVLHSLLILVLASPALEAAEPEKPDLKFGFIKLTDCAPLVIAKENFFEDEGLYVTLEAQANWKILLDRVISGELDGAHMLAGQPIAATIGFGTKAHIITAFSMDLNGNGITSSNRSGSKCRSEPASLEPTPSARSRPICSSPLFRNSRPAGTPMKMGMVFPVSTHNYELRYWLAAGGIVPGLLHPDGHDRNQGRRCFDLRHAAAADARDARAGNNPGLLRRRTVESTGRHPGIGVCGHH